VARTGCSRSRRPTSYASSTLRRSPTSTAPTPTRFRTQWPSCASAWQVARRCRAPTATTTTTTTTAAASVHMTPLAALGAVTRATRGRWLRNGASCFYSVQSFWTRRSIPCYTRSCSCSLRGATRRSAWTRRPSQSIPMSPACCEQPPRPQSAVVKPRQRARRRRRLCAPHRCLPRLVGGCSCAGFRTSLTRWAQQSQLQLALTTRHRRGSRLVWHPSSSCCSRSMACCRAVCGRRQAYWDMLSLAWSGSSTLVTQRRHGRSRHCAWSYPNSTKLQSAPPVLSSPS